MEKNTNNDLLIFFAEREDGTILAATNCPPYFYFTGRTEEELTARVAAALKFYAAHRNESAPVRSRSVSLTEFKTRKAVSAKTLVAA